MVRWGGWAENRLVDEVGNGQNSHKDTISTTQLAISPSLLAREGKCRGNKKRLTSIELKFRSISTLGTLYEIH